MNTERIKRFAEIAEKFHRDQKDLAGLPYFDHVDRVARRLLEFEMDDLVTAAYFHDFGEDVKDGRSILASMDDFTAEERFLISGMDTGEKPKGMSYDRFYIAVYLPKITKSPKLSLVKLADSLDNSDPNRLIDSSEKSIRRMFKYKIVIEHLVEKLEGTEFSLERMTEIAPKFASELKDRIAYFKEFYEEHKNVLSNSGYAKVKNEFGI